MRISLPIRGRGSMRRRFIFLDIDGVLNNHERYANGYCKMNQANVQELNELLARIPDAKIVIISSWRYMIQTRSMTMEGFTNLLLSHGVNILDTSEDTSQMDLMQKPVLKSRLYSRTVSDEQMSGRGKQIQHWMQDNMYDRLIDRHVVIDDMMWDFHKYKLNVVLCDAKFGMQRTQVEKSIQYLK